MTSYNNGTPGIWPDPTDASSVKVTSLGGITPRTLAVRAADIINVKDFGAVGDGTTDDTAAIQSAINQFTNGLTAIKSGTVLFPLGDYNITSTLTYAGGPGYGIRFVGLSSPTFATNGTVLRWAGAAGGTMMIVRGFNIHFEGIQFEGMALAKYGLVITNGQMFSGTLGTAVTPGTATVTPSSMTNIAVGSLIPVGTTGAQMEYVWVTATTGTTFTAVFTKSHGGTEAIGGGSATEHIYLFRSYFGGFSGATTAGVLAGNATTGGTPDVANIYIDSSTFYAPGRAGGATGNGTGLRTVGSGNVKNFYIYNSTFYYWNIGVDFAGTGGGANEISKTTFFNGTTTDIWAGQGALSIDGYESEGSPKFVTQAGNATGVISGLTVINSSYQGAAGVDDYVIDYSGPITLINTHLYNYRTGASIAKVRQFNSPLFVAGWHGGIVSINSFYQNAAGYAPFYDGSNNPILPTYYNHQPISVISLGDYGGTTQALVKLNNVVPVTRVTSQSAPFVADIGIVAAGSTDIAVAFRNNANTGDVIGLSKDATDVVGVGGTAGVRISGARIMTGTAAPIAGTWAVGDHVFNSVPSVGQPKGWFCTVAGTPGTWVSEGNL